MPEEDGTRQKYFSIGKAAKYLGVSKDTLRRWEKAGKITCHRTPGDRRRYTKEDLDKVLEEGIIRPYRKPSEPAPAKIKPISTLKPASEPRKPTPEAPKTEIKTEKLPPARVANDKKERKESFLDKMKKSTSAIFESKEDKRPTHYISTPSGPRQIKIRKPELSTFSNVFSHLSIHTVIFISVLVTTAAATILIFYVFFGGEGFELPKIGLPEIGGESEEIILSPIP